MPEDAAHDEPGRYHVYHVELPKYLYEELQDYLAAEDRTISAVVEEFVKDGLHARARDAAGPPPREGAQPPREGAQPPRPGARHADNSALGTRPRTSEEEYHG